MYNLASRISGNQYETYLFQFQTKTTNTFKSDIIRFIFKNLCCWSHCCWRACWLSWCWTWGRRRRPPSSRGLLCFHLRSWRRCWRLWKLEKQSRRIPFSPRCHFGNILLLKSFAFQKQRSLESFVKWINPRANIRNIQKATRDSN